MITIFEPNEDFPFEGVSLKPPVPTSGGGTFFSKYSVGIGREPLYIQTPMCYTKQGFTKASGGRKISADLVFCNQENQDFIRWMELLVQRTQREILDHSGAAGGKVWFENDFSEDDLDDAFIAPMKPYKGGKFQTLKVFANMQATGEPNLKVYDEHERELEVSAVNENTKILSILEIQGVKCSAKSFQIEVLIKQIMVLNRGADAFNTCLLAPRRSSVARTTTDSTPAAPPPVLVPETELDIHPEIEPSNFFDEPPAAIATQQTEIKKEEDVLDEFGDDEISKSGPTESDTPLLTEPQIDLASPPSSPTIEEINLDDLVPTEDATASPATLTAPNELYYKMYQEAKQRAREARTAAVQAYLAAREIKNRYGLDDVDDSDLEDEGSEAN